ncbi:MULTISPECIES: rcc01693 family protein [Phyllobacterium]|nr:MULTISPECIES: rcc01693 family protein [Phyllobacterium]
MKAAADQPVDAFPWDAIMKAGLGLLRLAPSAFWAMTLRELNAAFARPRALLAPTRSEIEQLMRMFPDDVEQ